MEEKTILKTHIPQNFKFYTILFFSSLQFTKFSLLNLAPLP